MNIKSFIIAGIAVCIALIPVQARKDRTPADDGGVFLIPLQQRDSVLIGDQFVYGATIKDVPAGTKVEVLKWEDGQLDPDVEIVLPWIVDTLKVNREKKNVKSVDLQAKMTMTSFEEGTYELPSIKLRRWFSDGVVDTLSFESRFLEFKTMPVDTATFEVHDIKGQIRYPLTPAEVLPYAVGLWLLAVLVIFVVCLVKIYGKKRQEALLHMEPAHIVALRKLDRYRGDKFWADDKQKAFYSGVTEALREYIDSRYGVGAKEMTSTEILDGLKKTDIPVELYDELKALFERADFVKFAKMIVSREDIATELPFAVRFVTETYQSEIVEENKEE